MDLNSWSLKRAEVMRKAQLDTASEIHMLLLLARKSELDEWLKAS